MRTPQTFFSIAQVFQEKYYLALARLEIFSKSRLRLNLGYGKSRLTFADKTPGQGKRKAATPEKLKYLSPLKGGLKPGSTIGYRSTRNDPCPADECLRSSAGQGSFRVLLSGLCRSVKSQALLSGWLHRTNLSGNSLPQPGGGGCIYALGIAVESPQPSGEDLEAESPTVYGNAQILQKKSVLIH